MNYECIDPKIRKLVKILNNKGIHTADSCAGVGPCASYKGRIMSKKHIRSSSWLTPYLTVLSEESHPRRLHDMICKASELIVKTQISSYPIQLCSITHTHYENIHKVEFRINDFLFVPMFFPEVNGVKEPRKFIYYWQTRWLKSMEKVAGEI